MTVIDAEPIFPSVRDFVRGAVLCVSGPVDHAVPAGISARIVISQDTSAHPLVED